ncbi:MAG TPA: nucleotidyltransferase domain-containing protein [Candidatus Nanoarchaeia archaeon]|nr:nucleotidyltransferase domain-containing protein [Candidatus Nanoarchaeia archaeon]
MFKIINTKRDWHVLQFFLDNPTTQIHLRGLAKELKISFGWLSLNLPRLVKSGLLLKKESLGGRLHLLQANRDSSLFQRLKTSTNLFALHDSGFLDALIAAYHQPECIVLFGSYRRGEDTEESDIDIAIITALRPKKDWSSFEQKLQRNIKIIELQKKRIEPEFMNTLANGIVVYGYLDVRP